MGASTETGKCTNTGTSAEAGRGKGGETDKGTGGGSGTWCLERGKKNGDKIRKFKYNYERLGRE